MLLGSLDQQKGTRKLLINLLFKKGYCLCIPDPTLINLHFEQVRSSWVQKFLLCKNALELSIIPMFMLIFIKNKALTVDESGRLFDLLQILISKAETDTIDQIFFANNFQNIPWVYYILGQLISFTIEDFISSDKNSERIMAIAAGIEFFFDKASPSTITKLTLNTENNGFNVLHKLFYVIAYKSLHSSQISYLSTISEKIINKTTKTEIEILSFQVQQKGFSFLWCVLGTWLQIVFEFENSNQFKINHYTTLINCLIKKIDTEKLSSILLENKTTGYIIILRYLFFQRVNLNSSPHDSKEDLQCRQWCQKIFSTLTIQEMGLILDKLPLLLNNSLNLSSRDRQQLLRNFFTYLFEFCNLQPLEIATLKKLQKQLENHFFPSNKIIKFFNQLQTCCGFFDAKFQGFKISEDIDESDELLRSGCARLTVNYLTMK